MMVTYHCDILISIGYTPRVRLLNHWATKPEVCNQLRATVKDPERGFKILLVA